MNVPKRILLGQLASNGDCLYATTVARQIKVDYPGCHLTWAIGSAWRSMIDGNPDVDEVWEVDYYTIPGDFPQWARFEAEARKRKKRGEFDEVFLTQITMPNMHLWTGGVRSAILRAYPHPITVDQSPVVRLSAREVENVRQFAQLHHLAEKSHVILFECAPRSGQSLVSPQFALEVAHAIVQKHPTVAIVLSSNHSFDSTHENIIDGSILTLRENAELTKYCSLLVGASSGITWISTSDWAKPLPMIQLVIPDSACSNSVVYDFKQRGETVSDIIEMHNYTAENVILCVETVICDGFTNAQSKYNQVTPFKYKRYHDIQYILLRQFHWRQASQLFMLNIKEYGFNFKFISIAIRILLRAALMAPRKAVSKIKGSGVHAP